MQLASPAHRRLAARPDSGVLVDIPIAAAALIGSLIFLHEGISASRPESELDLLGGLLAASAAAPLLAWRRAPFAVFAVSAAISTVAAALGYSLGVALGPTVAVYLLAASRDEANPWKLHTTVGVVALAVAYLTATGAAEHAFPGLEVFHAGLAWAVAWFAGERTRLRRERMAELEERAIRAERDADRERRLAIAEERARIARDLHDSAGHAINVIAVRAGAARLRHRDDPERSLSALEAIEELARGTVDDIDQIVHVLREGGFVNGNPFAPLGLASLGSLVAHHSHAGLDVTVRSSGGSRPLARAADQAAYRILQEALTNAARHGTGAAEIELAFGETALRLAITNPVREGVQPRSAGGHGLIGMRERTTLLDGTLTTERSNGSFRVRVELPYGSHRT